jgi:hypothetical protein
MLSTMALLRGPDAARWLQEVGVPHALVDAEGRLHTNFS